jgi:uncharacterized membrane protein YphA (DoxX/SURF4 family)
MRRLHVGLALLAVAIVLFTIDQLLPVRCFESPTFSECSQGFQPPAVWLVIPALALAGVVLIVLGLRVRPTA